MWVSFSCVGCPRTAEQELWITLLFCARLTCRSEVHCMDLICHWGQQEDLESPQVARLPQKSLVKVPKFYEFSPCKWWNQWNQMQHGSDEITFILLNRLNVFYLLRFVFFWSVPALIRSFGFHVIPWALAKLPLYNRYWRSALVPVASESKCMRQVVRKARNVSHWVLLLGLRYDYYYCHDSFLFLRKLLNLSVAV